MLVWDSCVEQSQTLGATQAGERERRVWENDGVGGTEGGRENIEEREQTLKRK